MKLRTGQTMIELMIAISLIAVGLLSALNLVYSNLALVNRVTDEVTAVNLAREGIEVTKQIRDSNWLAGNAFDLGLANATDYTGTIVWTGGAGATPSYDFTVNAITDANAKIVLNNGLYQQSGVAGSSTLFARLVTLHPICADYSIKNSGQDCGVSPAATWPKIGIRVESAIRWTRNGVTKTTTIYSDLYDWR